MTNTIKKTAAGVILAAVAMFGVATTTSAQTPTIESLLQMIADLTAQLNQLQGGSSNTTGGSCGVTTFGYTAPGMTLQQGSTGAAVSALQMALNNHAGANLGTDGVFGPMTRAAVVSFQASQGLATDGVFGPASASALVAASAMTTPCPTDNNTGGTGTTGGSVTLSGDEGFFNLDTVLDGATEIDLGTSEVVLEIDVEAKDSDIAINRVDFVFIQNDDNEARPWLYFDQVNLWMDGSQVASLSGNQSNFSSVTIGGDTYWRARFSGLNYVISEDDTSTMALQLRARSSMSGDRDDHTLLVGLGTNGIRAIDGAGLTQESVNAVDDYEATVTFNDTFGEGDVKVTLGNNSPESANIVLNQTTSSRTTGVTVLEFDVEADGGDIEVDDIEVEFAVTGGAATVAGSVHRAYLFRGNTQISQKAVNGNSVIFNNLNHMISEDDVETFRVRVDFESVNTMGANVPATFTVVDVEVMGENEDFEPVAETLPVNETHNIIETGLVAEIVSKSQSTSLLGGDETIGSFTFTFDVTAYGETFFFNEDGSDFAVSWTNDDNVEPLIVSVSSNAQLVAGGTAFRVNDGQTRSVTLTVQVQSSEDGEGLNQATRLTVDEMTFWTNQDLDEGEDTFEMGAPDFRANADLVVFRPAGA
jgi:hypothetical protein